MQKPIFLGTSKFHTVATISEHTFGSFTRTFYEFEYSKGSDPEVYKFRGSNIDYCLHGHSWFVCCVPKVVIPEESTPDQDPKEKQVGKKDAEISTGQIPSIPKISTSSDGRLELNPEESFISADQLIDDPAEFIRTAPLSSHYFARLQAHKATQKYDVDLELLLPGSKRPRKSPTPPRPPNSFMVYSMFIKDKNNLDLFLPTRNKTGPQTNADIGSLWNALPIEDKGFFSILAEFAKHLHHQLYPDYSYCPSKKSRSSCRGKKQKKQKKRKSTK